MRFDTRQQARLAQQMRLSPGLIQSMEILQLPLMALKERLELELESNVALEIDSPEAGEDLEQAAREREIFEGDHVPRLGTPPRAGERDPKMDAMANIRARDEPVTERLLREWSFADLEEDLARRGRAIIEHIDADGLLRLDLEVIQREAGRDWTSTQMEEALATVQARLEPPGIAARDHRECLLLQVAHLVAGEPGTWDTVRLLIDEHLDDLVHNRLPSIARETSLSMEDIHAAMVRMQQLHMAPGLEIVADEAPPVVPDVIVEYDIDRDRYDARPCDGSLPRLRISPRYRAMVGDRTLDQEARDFIGRSVSSARNLIDSIEQRRSTLMRVVEVVLDRQRGYFDEGASRLKPLPMGEVADLIGVHVATVSRAVSGKWLQTPRGMVSLRELFSGGLSTDAGSDMSWEAVKETLREIVEQEDSSKPFTDEALVEQLKERGISIARRTVVKYRGQLGIPPSMQRRTW